jgi:ComF family protein
LGTGKAGKTGVMMKLWQAFLSLIYPKICLNCNRKITSDTNFLCYFCQADLEFLLDELCPKCGSPKKAQSCNICTDFHFHKARSVFPFNKPVRSLIHHLKYYEFTKVADYLATCCYDYLQKYAPFPNIDIICPVPLHKIRKRSRGFNQAEKISKKLASYMAWKHIPDLILRTKHTSTQTKLSKIERNQNVSNAFSINTKYQIKNRSILVVDDVFTTGSTVNAISKVLEKYEVSGIYILTIARA